MSYKTKRLVGLILVLFIIPMSCAASCDDDENTIPDTGVADADELIENVADGAENVDDTLDTLWCLGEVNDWEVRCGGDGVAPAQ